MTWSRSCGRQKTAVGICKHPGGPASNSFISIACVLAGDTRKLHSLLGVVSCEVRSRSQIESLPISVRTTSAISCRYYRADYSCCPRAHCCGISLVPGYDMSCVVHSISIICTARRLQKARFDGVLTMLTRKCSVTWLFFAGNSVVCAVYPIGRHSLNPVHSSRVLREKVQGHCATLRRESHQPAERIGTLESELAEATGLKLEAEKHLEVGTW